MGFLFRSVVPVDLSVGKSHRLIVAIEGIDGAGKTTLVKAVASRIGEQVCVLSRTKKGKKWANLLNTEFITKRHFIQIPIYLLLSYVNFVKTRKKLHAPVVLMDRCFLSNICYFYPLAMSNRILLSLALLFEIKLFPQAIFLLDEDPVVAQRRDHYQKSLDWLTRTRDNYLAASCASALNAFHIQIVPKEISMEEKVDILCRYIIKMKMTPGNT